MKKYIKTNFWDILMLILLIVEIPITLIKDSVSVSSYIILLLVTIMEVLRFLFVRGNEIIEIN